MISHAAPAPNHFTDAWRYCEKARGRYRLMYADQDQEGLEGLLAVRVAGPYVAYIHYVSPMGPGNITCDVHVLEAASGRRVTVPDPTHGGFCSELRLASAGVLAGLAINNQVTTSYVLAYSFPSHHFYVLDSGASLRFDPEPLAIYDCASGCSPRAAIVAWTDSGAWRYAVVG